MQGVISSVRSHKAVQGVISFRSGCLFSRATQLVLYKFKLDFHYMHRVKNHTVESRLSAHFGLM